MNNIDKIFGIKYKDVVSITGAGGKTSLMYMFGEYFDKSLLTSTTKLFVPDDKITYIGKIPSIIEGSLVVAKKQIEDKLYGFDCSELKSFYSEFDYSFIEADGARMMSLKGWNSTEPVICDFSNKTIGVIDIKAYRKNIKETVFRIDELSKITELKENVSIQNLVDIILDPSGLFKNSKFKVLYINKVESDVETKNALYLIEELLKDKRFDLDRIVYGSIHKNQFELSYAKRGVFVLASGLSTRMGRDKLSIVLNGKRLIEHTIEKLSGYSGDLYLICNDNRFDKLAKQYGFNVIYNKDFEMGQSSSIKASLVADYHYYTYFLGDMPYLSEETINEVLASKEELLMCSHNNVLSAPTTLSYKYKGELAKLTGDKGARGIIKNHLNELFRLSIDETELKDIDTMADIRGEV